jgi:hypothetical protein
MNQQINIEQNASWGVIAHLAKKFPSFMEPDYHVNKDPQLDHILSQLNPVHIQLIYLRSTLILPWNVRLNYTSGLFSVLSKTN